MSFARCAHNFLNSPLKWHFTIIVKAGVAPVGGGRGVKALQKKSEKQKKWCIFMHQSYWITSLTKKNIFWKGFLLRFYHLKGISCPWFLLWELSPATPRTYEVVSPPLMIYTLALSPCQRQQKNDSLLFNHHTMDSVHPAAIFGIKVTLGWVSAETAYFNTHALNFTQLCTAHWDTPSHSYHKWIQNSRNMKRVYWWRAGIDEPRKFNVEICCGGYLAFTYGECALYLLIFHS